MPTTIHGIKACDTMKKARAWLDGAGVAYGFHDYKAQGIDTATLRRWCAAVGWETLLNRSGTTFRKLSDADRADLDAAQAVAWTRAHIGAYGGDDRRIFLIGSLSFRGFTQTSIRSGRRISCTFLMRLQRNV